MYKIALQLFFLVSFSLQLEIAFFQKTGGVYGLLCTCERRVPAEYQPTHRKGWEREGIYDKLSNRERNLYIVIVL